VRRDIYQVIELQAGENIKLNEYNIIGFEVLNNKTIKIDDKQIILSAESYENLKKSLLH
jgi:hypothetical protein